MSPFRPVTPRFAAAAQLTAAQFAEAAAAGYRTVINNRPEGESADQLPGDQARAAAQAAGLAYVEIPITGQPSIEQVERFAEVLAQAEGPVLGYCRSGTRSITAWALASAFTGAYSSDAILQAAADAGYDLSPWRQTLERLNGGS